VNVDLILSTLGRLQVNYILQESSVLKTASGVPFRSLSDRSMLRCQEALPEKDRKLRRMEILRAAIAKRGSR
jgi:hypothetical protein